MVFLGWLFPKVDRAPVESNFDKMRRDWKEREDKHIALLRDLYKLGPSPEIVRQQERERCVKIANIVRQQERERCVKIANLVAMRYLDTVGLQAAQEVAKIISDQSSP